MIPYAEITDTADRHWTARLLDRLGEADLPDAELDQLVSALRAVSDPRSVSPLEAMLTDPARPQRVRDAAGVVLRDMQYLAIDVPPEKLRRWWHEGDAVLRRHALFNMDACDCPDVLLAVASHPGHPLHAEALGRMTFHFELPEHQRLKIAGLSHHDPKVRGAAVSVLFWDEPVAAEGPLLEATRDPVPEVAADACITLQYYPTRRVACCLHGLLDHPAELVREEARVSFAEVRGEFLLGLRSRDRRVARRVRRWLQPVWDLLAFSDDELRRDDDDGHAARSPQPMEPVLLADLLATLGDPDASPKALQEALWQFNWRGHAAKRGRLRRVLLGHPDPLVREEAAVACEAWQDAEGLLALAGDADFGVRKAALYRMGGLPPTPGVADLAWWHLHLPDALGAHATETLATFVRHADPTVAVTRLGWIAGDHGWREGLRTAAVYHLADLGAAEQLGQLAGLLREPPQVTWALHLALLDGVRALGLPTPDVRHLAEVDNLHVQEAVARARG